MNVLKEFLRDIDKENTKKNYEKNIALFEQYLTSEEVDLLECRVMHINRFRKELESKGYSVASCNTIIAAIKSFYRFVGENGFMYPNSGLDSFKNIAEDIKLNWYKAEVRDQFLTNNELKMFLDYLKNMIRKPNMRNFYFKKARDYFMVVLVSNFGLRSNEIEELKEEFFDLENGILYIPGEVRKNGEELILSLPDSIVQLYLNYLEVRNNEFEESEYVFVSTNNKRLTNKAINLMLKDRIAEANEFYGSEVVRTDISIHSLRRTASYTLQQNGLNINEVANVLGQKQITTTLKHYTPVDSETIKHKINIIA